MTIIAIAHTIIIIPNTLLKFDFVVSILLKIEIDVYYISRDIFQSLHFGGIKSSHPILQSLPGCTTLHMPCG